MLALVGASISTESWIRFRIPAPHLDLRALSYLIAKVKVISDAVLCIGKFTASFSRALRFSLVIRPNLRRRPNKVSIDLPRFGAALQVRMYCAAFGALRNHSLIIL